MDSDSTLPAESDGDAPLAKVRKYLTALVRSFEIMLAFRPGDRSLGKDELSRATGIPKATVTRLAHTLASLGYLRTVSSRGKHEPPESILAHGHALAQPLRRLR
jgi:DNA-binding IclR family transcriptional regulator